MKLFSTNLSCKKLFSLVLITLVICSCSFLASAQVIVPFGNPNDSTDRQPLGSFYGYERTEALYQNSEINTTGYVTQLAFYVNSLNVPALSTPVVIKMNTTTSTAISAATYSDASVGATTVWSGNITSSMLTEDSWVTVTLSTPFNYASNNLEVFVETNYGDFGGENWDSKGIRLSDTTFNVSQYWESDASVPTDLGELNTFRPNIQLTFGTLCSGTPNPGNTISSMDSVCSGSSFTLSLQNISVGAGLTYQWQTSTDGINNWTNALAATNATYTTSQIAVEHYRCNVTCTNGGQTATSVQLPVYMQTFYHCYCASYATSTEDTKIDSVKIGAISAGTDPLQCESYTDYTGGNVATLNPGEPSTIHIVNGSCTGDEFGSYVAVYIDMNHNTSFAEANELVYSYGPINSLNGIPDGTFFIPVTATSGTTGMRVVLEEGISTPSSCGTYSRGETEDYLVNISAVTACSGTPSPGATYSTMYSVCPNENFTLSIENYPSQTGIAYQWQYSNDSIAWSSVSGGTNYTCIDSQIATRYYRCKLTCSNSGGIGYSDAIKITMNPFYECYCASHSTDILSNDTKIDSVQFGTINSGSDPNHCESYTDYTNLTTDLPIGVPTTIHIVNGSCDQQYYESHVAVYIDYNRDGDYFDAGELVYSDTTIGLNSLPSHDIIPIGANIGLTGMRVIIEEGDSVPSPCGLYQFGETEDYTVNIVEGNACIDPPQPGSATATPTSVCFDALPFTISLSLSDNSSGIGQTYQWQDSINNGSWANLIGQTSLTASALINAGSDTHYYRCLVHCGAHTLPSTTATVTINPTPAGNTIDDPILITSLPYTDFNNNLSSNCYTSDYTGANQQPSPDVFYKLTTPGELGSLTVSTCNTTDLNTVIHLLDGNGIEFFTNDDNGNMCFPSVEASDSFYVGLTSQTFYIVVEGQGNSEGNYQLNVNFIVGTGENQIQNSSSEVSLFPNPNSGTFDVSFDLRQNINDVASMTITNVIGQVIDEEKIAVKNGKLSKEISLSNPSSDGLYFVSIRVNDLLMNKRFILQR